MSAKQIIQDRIDQRLKELKEQGSSELETLPPYPEDNQLYEYEMTIILRELRTLKAQVKDFQFTMKDLEHAYVRGTTALLDTGHGENFEDYRKRKGL
jgi:hypothetical protein